MFSRVTNACESGIHVAPEAESRAKLAAANVNLQIFLCENFLFIFLPKQIFLRVFKLWLEVHFKPCARYICGLWIFALIYIYLEIGLDGDGGRNLNAVCNFQRSFVVRVFGASRALVFNNWKSDREYIVFSARYGGKPVEAEVRVEIVVGGSAARNPTYAGVDAELRIALVSFIKACCKPT